jgi:hypothetical protein
MSTCDPIYKKINFLVQGKFEKLPDKYLQRYNEFKTDNYGTEIIDVGRTLLKYIIEVIKKDAKKGAEFINYLSTGYPGKPNTDFYFSIYECINLQRLYVESLKEFGFKNVRNQGLIINAYFRWYCSVYETYRKLLVFCLVCHKFSTDQTFNNIDYYLFNIGHPEKILKSETPSSKHKSILEYFEGNIRHSISHSNIMLLKGIKEPNLFSIVIRHSSDEKNSSFQEGFDTFEDFVKNVDKNISILYQSMRFFLTYSTGFIIEMYGEKYNDFLGGTINVDPVTQRMVNDGALF